MLITEPVNLGFWPMLAVVWFLVGLRATGRRFRWQDFAGSCSEMAMSKGFCETDNTSDGELGSTGP